MGVVAATREDESVYAEEQTSLPTILGRRRNTALRRLFIVSAVLSLAGFAVLSINGSQGDIVSDTTITRQINDLPRRRRLSEVTATRVRHIQQQQQQQQQQQPRTKFGTFKVVERFPHDPNAFTQGLQMANATHYYESIGLYGKSAVRIVKLSTGVPVLETKMSSDYFGEGMCLYTVAGQGGRATSSRLIQITWKEKEAFIYNSKTIKEIGRIPFETSNGEGWGITFDTARNVLYVTDGSSTLHTWDLPTDSDIFGNVQSIDSIREVQVYKKRRNQRRVSMENLNELEYDDADGTVLANIWQQDTIVRINPRNGFVRKIYNMSSLYPRNERSPTADVLNGIAKVPNGTPNEFLITGKKWPWIYRVRFDD